MAATWKSISAHTQSVMPIKLQDVWAIITLAVLQFTTMAMVCTIVTCLTQFIDLC